MLTLPQVSFTHSYSSPAPFNQNLYLVAMRSSTALGSEAIRTSLSNQLCDMVRSRNSEREQMQRVCKTIAVQDPRKTHVTSKLTYTQSSKSHLVLHVKLPLCWQWFNMQFQTQHVFTESWDFVPRIKTGLPKISHQALPSTANHKCVYSASMKNS